MKTSNVMGLLALIALLGGIVAVIINSKWVAAALIAELVIFIITANYYTKVERDEAIGSAS